jgi:glycosyltransferase involved in cell wall biosynthesis
MPNILLVANYSSDTAYAWWLIEQFWKSIALHFESSGRRTFLAYPKLNAIPDAIAQSPIEVIELKLPWVNKDQKNKFKQLIKKENIEYIYFSDQKYFNPQYFLMHLYGIKKIINHNHYHIMDSRKPGIDIKSLIKKNRNRLPFVCVDFVFCVSELMYQRSIHVQQIPAEKCYNIQNGITPLIENRNETDSLREELGIDKNTLIIISTGRFNSHKRFDFIIDCAHELKKTSPNLDYIFLLVGDGPTYNEMKSKVRELDLEKHVKLLGFRSDVQDLLFISDIALHASKGEAFSLSVLEYLSSGTPTLLPDRPSVYQAVEHGKTGYIYSRNSVKEVVMYINKLSENSLGRIKMGIRGKRVVDEKYQLQQCLNTLVGTLEKTLKLGSTQNASPTPERQ